MPAETMTEILNPGAASRDPDFPHAPTDWSREAAEQAASTDGITLTTDHWTTIQALQAYFSQNDQDINIRELHDALDEAFHTQGGIKYLYGLFPGGPVAQGARFAGFEPPPGSVDPSFGSVQ